MGLFPVISRPALSDVLRAGGVVDREALESLVGHWNGIAIAGFLVGAATGGVLFGWLGDRIGRVRAMSLSILTYALVSGMGAFATSPWQIVVVRYVAALGMGGEWSLGVALVVEVWGDRSRGMLAGWIGLAANAGYALVALLSLGLDSIREAIATLGLSPSWVEWRLLMLCGVAPALLTFFVRRFVPESESWVREKSEGRTSAWATQDLKGVLFGSLVALGLLFMWGRTTWLTVRIGATLLAIALISRGFLHPVLQYLTRSAVPPAESRRILGRMLLGAILSGVPLLGTWAAVQWAPTWADQISQGFPQAKAYSQLASATGAMLGAWLGAVMADWIGRRPAYILLCLLSFGSVLLFYLTNDRVSAYFLSTALLMGGCTAAFYGWLPLYLPELFPTRVRATGQGFGFNFGRILAAIGALQTGAIMKAFPGGYPRACSIMGSVYLLGLLIIWLAPETKGRPLPD